MAFPVELGLIIFFSILGGVLAVRFKQPSVLGLILIGAIVGPNAFGFIKDASLINASIEIGAILLLFTVGIEFSLQHLFRIGLRVIIITVVKLGAVFLLSYYASLLLGFSFITSLYIGIILSITSTVIVVKILEQKGMSGRDELPLLISILVIEDIFGVFALTFLSGINAKSDLLPLNLFTELIISLAFMAIAYLILQRVMKPFIIWLVKYSTEDTITLISIGMCGLMSYIALLFNLSPSVGAFLAGNIVASFPNSGIFEKAIRPFILTFTSLFFFSIGTIVNFSAIIGSIYVIIALFLVNTASKFLTVGFGSYLLTNFSGKQAVFSGIAMVSVGEFSLLIAKEAGALSLGVDLVSITAAIILLSSVAMSVFVSYSEKIYDLTAKLIAPMAKEDMALASKYLNSISLSMLLDRVGTKKIIAEWKTVLNNIVAVFFILAFSFLIWRYFGHALTGLFKSQLVVYSIVIFLFALIFFPTVNVVRNAASLLKDILKFFVRLYPDEISSEKKIFRNIILTLVLFAALLVFPGIFAFFRLKPVYNILVLLLIIIILFYVFKASSLIHAVAKKHELAFNKSSRKYRLWMKERMKIRKGY